MFKLFSFKTMLLTVLFTCSSFAQSNLNGTVSLNGIPLPDFTLLISTDAPGVELPQDSLLAQMGIFDYPVTTDDNGYYEVNLDSGVEYTITPFDTFSYQPFTYHVLLNAVSPGDTTLDIPVSERTQDAKVSGDITLNGEDTDVTLYFFKIRDEDDILEFIEEGPSHLSYNFFEAWPSKFYQSEFWANLEEGQPAPAPFFASEYWGSLGGGWPSPSPYFVSEYWANSVGGHPAPAPFYVEEYWANLGGIGFGGWPAFRYNFFEAWPSYRTRTTGRKAGRLNHNMINGKYIVYIPGCDE